MCHHKLSTSPAARSRRSLAESSLAGVPRAFGAERVLTFATLGNHRIFWITRHMPEYLPSNMSLQLTSRRMPNLARAGIDKTHQRLVVESI